MQWIQGFPSLEVFLPLNLILDKCENIGKQNESETYHKHRHVFPLLKTCDFSPLEHQASGAFDVITSLPLSMWLSFDVISLSPFDINLQEGIFCIVSQNRFGPWVTEQSNKLNVMLVEDKNHSVEVDQEESRN